MTTNKHHIVIQASIMAPQTLGPPAGYQPLANGEITPEVSQVAKGLLGGEMGTQTPFSVDEKQYMARVETHYHPPPPQGSTPAEQAKYQKPWGYHKGVTVYKPAATRQTRQWQTTTVAKNRSNAQRVQGLRAFDTVDDATLRGIVLTDFDFHFIA